VPAISSRQSGSIQCMAELLASTVGQSCQGYRKARANARSVDCKG
jgi:hypothetical protein